MLNRRTFTTAIAAADIAGVVRALEVDDDDAIRDILKQRVEVEKRTVGMALCVVTPNRKYFVAYGRERLGDLRPVTSERCSRSARSPKCLLHSCWPTWRASQLARNGEAVMFASNSIEALASGGGVVDATVAAIGGGGTGFVIGAGIGVAVTDPLCPGQKK